MADRTDHTALRRLSAAEREHQRTARVEALGRLRAAHRALPNPVGCPRGDLCRVRAEILSELRAQVTAATPFAAVPLESLS